MFSGGGGLGVGLGPPALEYRPLLHLTDSHDVTDTVDITGCVIPFQKSERKNNKKMYHQGVNPLQKPGKITKNISQGASTHFKKMKRTKTFL